jgi:hypothetical protein
MFGDAALTRGGRCRVLLLAVVRVAYVVVRAGFFGLKMGPKKELVRARDRSAAEAGSARTLLT